MRRDARSRRDALRASEGLARFPKKNADITLFLRKSVTSFLYPRFSLKNADM